MLKAILRVVAFVVLWLVFLFIGMGATTWFSNHSVTGLTDPQQIKQVRFAADLQGIGLVFPLSILIPALIAFKPRPLTIILAGSFSVLSHYLLFPSAVMFAKQHQLVIDHVEASRALNPHGTEPITAQQRAIKS